MGMLHLTRKINEKIYIGNNITVTVLANSQKQVKLGIAAPLDIAIVRQEILGKPKKMKYDKPVPVVKKKKRRKITLDELRCM